jgi:hypothetical protein
LESECRGYAGVSGRRVNQTGFVHPLGGGLHRSTARIRMGVFIPSVIFAKTAGPLPPAESMPGPASSLEGYSRLARKRADATAVGSKEGKARMIKFRRSLRRCLKPIGLCRSRCAPGHGQVPRFESRPSIALRVACRSRYSSTRTQFVQSPSTSVSLRARFQIVRPSNLP